MNLFVLAVCKKVKQLSDEIEGLKSKNNDLKSENDKLKRTNEEQQEKIDQQGKDITECHDKGMGYKIVLLIRIHMLEAVYHALMAGM